VTRLLWTIADARRPGSGERPGLYVVNEETRRTLAPPPVDEAEHALISAEDMPTDDQAFAAYADLGACADGDWPPSTYRLVADSVPREVATRFGTLWETNFNGFYAVLDPGKRVALFDELAALGNDLAETPWLSELVDTF
jgi:hypothetical protein